MKRLLLIACLWAGCEENQNTGEQWWAECQDGQANQPDCEDGQTDCYKEDFVVYCDCGKWHLSINCEVLASTCENDTFSAPFCEYGGETMTEFLFGTPDDPDCPYWLETIERLTYLCRTRIFEECAEEYCD